MKKPEVEKLVTLSLYTGFENLALSWPPSRLDGT
jgi:hypothetical protein